MLRSPLTKVLDEQACYDELLHLLQPHGLQCPHGHPLAPTRLPMTAIASWAIIAAGRAGPSSTSSPARSSAKVATPARSYCKSCAALPRASRWRIWPPSCTLTVAISYAAVMLSTRCFSSAFPPSVLPDRVQESDGGYVNTREKGGKQCDLARPPPRRANKYKGHGTWTNDRPPMPWIGGRTSGQIRVLVLHQSTAAALRPLIEAITPIGSTLNTDEWRGYAWGRPVGGPPDGEPQPRSAGMGAG